MSDVDPQRDRESNCERRGWQLVSASPAREDRLARYVRSPAHAELPYYRRGTQLKQMTYNGIIYKAGEYTVEFLSPRISHVAKTEREFATSVDDLGPVEIPCNSLSLEIADSSTSSIRRTSAEAAEMIRDYLQGQHPQLNPDVRLPLEELAIPEAWERLRVQLFRITEGPFVNESFLIKGDSVLPIGEATGGRGLISLEISDLDRDGTAELLFTYAFGSGIHQSRIGMYAPMYGPDRTYEAATGYFGDLGLVKEDESTVSVRVVEPDEATLTLRYLDLLGTLAIQVNGAQAELVLHLAEDLPENVRDQLLDITG